MLHFKESNFDVSRAELRTLFMFLLLVSSSLSPQNVQNSIQSKSFKNDHNRNKIMKIVYL